MNNLFTVSRNSPQPQTQHDESSLRTLNRLRDEVEAKLRTLQQADTDFEVTEIDGATVTILNASALRTKLGLDALLSNLEAQIQNLLAQIAALSVQLTDGLNELRDVDDAHLERIIALENDLAAVQAATPTIPSFDVKTIGGTDLYDFSNVALRDWQNLVIESPQTGKLYRLQSIVDAGGQTNFDLVEADTLKASDGRRWRLRVEFTDGIPNLAAPELL